MLNKKKRQGVAVAGLLLLLAPMYLLIHNHAYTESERRPARLTIPSSPPHGRERKDFVEEGLDARSTTHAAVQRVRVLLADDRDRRLQTTSSSDGGKSTDGLAAFVSGRVKCKHRTCRDFLDEDDMAHFSYCWKRTGLKREPKRSTCRFLNATNRSPVALASFAGSGNTWVRGLLQLATGICTGGVYCDVTLRKSGYPGECLRSGKTLVVKTHLPDPKWTGVKYLPSVFDNQFLKASKIPVFSSAIFLVRNPFDALVAEFNRLISDNRSDSHVRTIDEKFFSKTKFYNNRKQCINLTRSGKIQHFADFRQNCDFVFSIYNVRVTSLLSMSIYNNVPSVSYSAL